jgi:predicted 3-demethylubiquinone-9 3-methyltransferase (glyoxalase superfamily)
MITPDDLQNRAVGLTPRQAKAVELVEQYYRTLGEPPSYGWLARRFGISRQGAADLMQRARDRRIRRPLTE